MDIHCNELLTRGGWAFPDESGSPQGFSPTSSKQLSCNFCLAHRELTLAASRQNALQKVLYKKFPWLFCCCFLHTLFNLIMNLSCNKTYYRKQTLHTRKKEGDLQSCWKWHVFLVIIFFFFSVCPSPQSLSWQEFPGIKESICFSFRQVMCFRRLYYPQHTHTEKHKVLIHSLAQNFTLVC